VLTKIGVATKLVSMFDNEITTTNCLGGIGIHVYVVEGWKRIHILLTLDQMLFNVIDNRQLT
jgi:hypothetical protein